MADGGGSGGRSARRARYGVTGPTTRNRSGKTRSYGPQPNHGMNNTFSGKAPTAAQRRRTSRSVPTIGPGGKAPRRHSNVQTSSRTISPNRRRNRSS